MYSWKTEKFSITLWLYSGGYAASDLLLSPRVWGGSGWRIFAKMNSLRPVHRQGVSVGLLSLTRATAV